MRAAWTAAVVLAFILLAATTVPAGASPAYDVKVVGRLPSGNYRAASVDTGKAVYIFGGRDESNLTASVLKYDRGIGAMTTASFSLPQPRQSACAVYDGKCAYVFGGADGGLELDTILRIDPASGDVRTLEARLPSPRIGLVAASFGKSVYLFGGHSNGTKITNITRFDPATGNISLMGASLPSGRAGMGIVAARNGIYLFGGKTDPGASDEVLLYEPQKDLLTVLPGRLPYTVYHASAVATGSKMLLIGGNAELPGWNVSRATDTIIEIDPHSGASRVLKERLPSPRERTVAAADGSRVLVFGGQEGVKALDEIVALEPSKAPGASGTATWMVAVAIVVLSCAALYAAALGGRPR